MECTQCFQGLCLKREGEEYSVSQGTSDPKRAFQNGRIIECLYVNKIQKRGNIDDVS